MSFASFPRANWQRVFIIVTAVFMGGFVGAVLWHISVWPEIGLQCTFTPRVSGVYDEYIVWPRGETGTRRLEDSTIVQLGDAEVRTWRQLLWALEGLEKKTDSDFVETKGPPSGDDVYARWGGDKHVRVSLLDPAGKRFDVWCRIGTPPLTTLVPSLAWFVLEMGVYFLAAFVFWKRPQDRSARLFFILTVVVIIAFMGGYHWTRIVTQPLIVLPLMTCAVLVPAVSLHFYQLFPRPKPWFLVRPYWTLAVTYGPSVLFLLALAVLYGVGRTLARGGADVTAQVAVLEWIRRLIFAYFGVSGLLYLASVLCLFHSYRRARAEMERNQVRWIFFGSVLATVPLAYSLYLAVWPTADIGGGTGMWPLFGVSLCFTAAFAVSITRYRLLQLDQLVSSGMAYFLVSAVAAAVYYLLVFTGTLVMGRQGIPGTPLEQAFWVSGSALVMTIGLDLARSRLRRVLDRRYRKDKSQLDRTLQEMGDVIEQLVDPPTLARRLLRAAADLLDIAEGTVYLRQGEPPTFAAAGSLGRAPLVNVVDHDDPLPMALLEHEVLLVRWEGGAARSLAVLRLRELGGRAAVALTHEGTLRAFLILGYKADGADITTDDRDLLTAIVPFTALALASAEGHRTIETLNRELQTKVEKISEQQRRILALQQQLTTQAKFVTKVTPAEVAAPPADLPAGSIVGSSPALRQVLGLARKVAASPSAVLIRGESGTGKELLARAVHDNSPRADKPFVKVHCAALAPSLLESELFGHVKGAFTGAVRDKVGRFELADGGTLFLDEIGDITLEVQTKLLRVLQEKIFERVGSSDPVKVDVRMVAATHQNLEHLIRHGRFREDLFYRLNVITLAMPPLRERPEDVPELAVHFLRLYAKKCGKPIEHIDDEALLALRAYRWPGNVRELENAVERAVVIADGSVLTLAELPEEVRRETDAGELDGEALAHVDVAPARWGLRTERESRNLRERDALLRALATTDGNKAEAARLLGLARSTLVSRLKKHGLLKEQ
jgi:transcriptional regulator with GAF, ATPase, and Fis domain